MTIINNKYKFIFIHIPKNAGTSITNFFSLYHTPIDVEIGGSAIGELLQTEYLKRFGIGKHASAKKLQHSLSFIWPSYYKFAVVRSPYARFISAYNFLKNWTGPITYHVSDVMKACNSIEDFIDSFSRIPDGFADNIFKPQVYWVCDGNDRLVDNIIKYENLENELKQVVAHIQHREANIELLKKLNANVDNDFEQSKMSQKLINFINENYQSDFSEFSYEML